MCGSSPRVFHKSVEQKAVPAFCAFPVRAAKAARSLTGALSPVRLAFSPRRPSLFLPVPVCMHLLPSASPAPVPAPASSVLVPCVSLQPSRQMLTIQNLRRSLVRNWRPVCSVVGDAVLGAEPAPFPSHLPPVGLGRSAACELFSGLARSLCSANGRQCVRAS